LILFKNIKIGQFEQLVVFKWFFIEICVSPTVLKEPEIIAVPEPVAEKEKEDFFSMTLRPFKRKAQTLPDMPIVETVVTVNAEEIEEEVAHHYVGALR
jgi:hypothetical protein